MYLRHQNHAGLHVELPTRAGSAILHARVTCYYPQNCRRAGSFMDRFELQLFSY